jgi:hypothetical protein
MKIRIKGNSLRYRLTRPEVERFAKTGRLEEQINFGGPLLYYSILMTDSDQLSAAFSGNRITLFFPAAFLDEWIHTDRAGFDNRMPLDTTDETLYLLVEKDYTCLDNVTEDQSDHYPNPLKKSL